jgi:hypothetical protein
MQKRLIALWDLPIHLEWRIVPSHASVLASPHRPYLKILEETFHDITFEQPFIPVPWMHLCGPL